MDLLLCKSTISATGKKPRHRLTFVSKKACNAIKTVLLACNKGARTKNSNFTRALSSQTLRKPRNDSKCERVPIRINKRSRIRSRSSTPENTLSTWPTSCFTSLISDRKKRSKTFRRRTKSAKPKFNGKRVRYKISSQLRCGAQAMFKVKKER